MNTNGSSSPMSASSLKIRRVKKNKATVLEKYLFPSPLWQEGYKSFIRLFGRPEAWLYGVDEEGGAHLIHLDRKGGCSQIYYSDSDFSLHGTESFHLKYGEQILQNEDQY